MVIVTEPWKLDRENDSQEGGVAHRGGVKGGRILVLKATAGPIGVALTEEQWADFPLGAELEDVPRQAA